MHTVHISKLYIDDTGILPIKARSRNQCLIVAYHCDSNAILVDPFKTCKDKHRLEAYKSIMTRLRKNGMSVNLQILDNEAISKFKHLIIEDLGIKYQLVPPEIHRHNAEEQGIRTFKSHFLSILAGIAPESPKFLWNHLLPQTETTLFFYENQLLTQPNRRGNFSMPRLTMPLPLLGLLGSK